MPAVSLGVQPKSDVDNLTYTFDWSGWMNAGDTIQSSSWSVPPGLTNLTSSSTPTTALIKLGGGTVGTSYVVTNTILTSVSGETKGASLTLKIK
jgi:hypothetical protein